MLYYKVYNDTDDISIIKNTFMKISYPFNIFSHNYKNNL